MKDLDDGQAEDSDERLQAGHSGAGVDAVLYQPRAYWHQHPGPVHTEGVQSNLNISQDICDNLHSHPGAQVRPELYHRLQDM